VGATETVGRRAREAAEKAVRGGRDQEGVVEEDDASPEVAAAQRRARPTSDAGDLPGSKGSRSTT
jgi:hypothetical protein